MRIQDSPVASARGEGVDLAVSDSLRDPLPFDILVKVMLLLHHGFRTFL